MTSLGDWLKKLVGTVVVMGFLDLLLPEGEMHRFARTIMGLLVLLVMLQPLAALFDQGPALDRILEMPAVHGAAPAATAASAARVSAAGLAALERARRAAMERAIREFTGGAAVTVTADGGGRPYVVVRLRDGGDPSTLRQAIASLYGLPETAVEVIMDD